MKLKVKEITGDVTPLEVDPNETIRDVKKRMWASGYFPLPFRLLRGQNEVLHDNSTLKQLKIKDDVTLNLLAEPEAKIQMKVELPYTKETVDWKARNTRTADGVKDHLIRNQFLASRPEDFDLVLEGTADRQQTVLENNLPLFLYVSGAKKDEIPTARVTVRISVRIVEMFQATRPHYPATRLNINKDTTVEGLLQAYRGNAPAGLFVTSDETGGFWKLSTRRGVLEQLGSSYRLYCLEDCESDFGWELFNSDGTFTGYKVHGKENFDSVLSLRLRAQEQLGAPACRLQVLSELPSDGGEEARHREPQVNVDHIRPEGNGMTRPEANGMTLPEANDHGALGRAIRGASGGGGPGPARRREMEDKDLKTLADEARVCQSDRLCLRGVSQRQLASSGPLGTG